MADSRVTVSVSVKDENSKEVADKIVSDLNRVKTAADKASESVNQIADKEKDLSSAAKNTADATKQSAANVKDQATSAGKVGRETRKAMQAAEQQAESVKSVGEAAVESSKKQKTASDSVVRTAQKEEKATRQSASSRVKTAAQSTEALRKEAEKTKAFFSKPISDKDLAVLPPKVLQRRVDAIKGVLTDGTKEIGGIFDKNSKVHVDGVLGFGRAEELSKELKRYQEQLDGLTKRGTNPAQDRIDLAAQKQRESLQQAQLKAVSEYQSSAKNIAAQEKAQQEAYKKAQTDAVESYKQRAKAEADQEKAEQEAAQKKLAQEQAAAKAKEEQERAYRQSVKDAVQEQDLLKNFRDIDLSKKTRPQLKQILDTYARLQQQFDENKGNVSVADQKALWNFAEQARKQYNHYGQDFNTKKLKENTAAQEAANKAAEQAQEINDANKGEKITKPTSQENPSQNIDKESASSTELLANVELLKRGIETVTDACDKMASAGITAFKAMGAGINLAVQGVSALASRLGDVVKEKIAPLTEAISAAKNKIETFGKTWAKNIAKIARTGVFMIVRKAFTALLSSIGDAVNSLAKYSNSIDGIDGKFNGAMSHIWSASNNMVANLVAAFEPILAVIVPILETLISWINTALQAVNEFFSALFGFATFTTPKNSLQNYAEKGISGGSSGGGSSDSNAKYQANVLGLDEANVNATDSTDGLTASLDNETKAATKAARALKKYNTFALGIDELNVFNVPESSSGGSGGSGGSYPFDWQINDVSDGMKDLADKFKSYWDKFMNPLKQAWDNAKDYILSGWDYMWKNLKKLFKDILDDWLRVWNEKKTISMLTTLLKVIGDIEYTIGNLARQFDSAWNNASTGLKIFRNIRDICYELVEGLRNITKYTRDWSGELDFNPMLQSFESMTKSLIQVASFVARTAYDVMKDGVLKFQKFLIEDEIPHTNKAIEKVIENIDWENLRENIDQIAISVENILERVSEATTELLEHIGLDVGDFLNSSEFDTLVDTITGFIDNFPVDAVRKIFEDIADGVEKVAKNLADFINSKEFIDFINNIYAFIKKVGDSKVISHLFDAISKAIADIAKKLLSFVNSKEFQGFLNGIIEFLKKVDYKTVEKVLGGLATAIIAFKFTSFVGSGLTGFITFLSALSTIKAGGIASSITGIFTTMKASCGTIFSYKWSDLATSISGITQSLSAISVGSVLKSIPTALSGMASKLLSVSSTLGIIPQLAGGAITAFAEFKTVSGTTKDLADGVGDVKTNIVKLAGEVGVATVAFTALLGFPAGIIASGCVAAIGAFEGVKQAWEENLNNLKGDAIRDALTTPGGVSLDDLASNFSEQIGDIGDAFEDITTGTSQLLNSQTSIDQTVTSIESIKSAMENGHLSVAEGCDLIVNEFIDLNNQVSDQMDSLKQSIEGTFGPNTVLGKIAEQVGLDVDAIDQAVETVTQKVKSREESITSELEELYKKQAEGQEVSQARIDWLETEAIKIAGSSGEIDNALTELKASYTANQIDLSDYITGDGELQINVDALNSTLDSVGDSFVTARKSVKEGGTNLVTEYQAFADKAGAVGEYAEQKLFEDAIGKVPDLVNQANADTQETLTAYMDGIQTAFIDRIPEIAANAKQEWEDNKDEMIGHGFVDSSLYVYDVIEQYSSAIDQVGEAVQTKYNELGVQGSAWASDAMQEILTAYTDPKTGSIDWDGLQTALTTGWEDTSNELKTKVDGYGAELVDTMQDSMLSEADQRTLDTIGRMTQQTAEALAKETGQYEEPGQKAAETYFNAASTSADGLALDCAGHMTQAAAEELARRAGDYVEPGSVAASKYSEGVKDAADSSDAGAYAANKLKTDFEENDVDWYALTQEDGKDLNQGFLDGFGSNSDEVTTTVHNLFDPLPDDIKTSLGEHSPSIYTQEAGKYFVAGFVNVINEDTTADTSVKTLASRIVTSFNEAIHTGIDSIKKSASSLFAGLFDSVDFAAETTGLVVKLENSLSASLGVLFSSFLPQYFSTDKWQPLFDTFSSTLVSEIDTIKETFMAAYMELWTEFTSAYFTEDFFTETLFTPFLTSLTTEWELFKVESVTEYGTWWDEFTAEYFCDEMWNTKIFEPIKTLYKTWWEEMKTLIKTNVEVDLWQGIIEKFFSQEKWTPKFDLLKKMWKETFENINKTIKEKMDEAFEHINELITNLEQRLTTMMDKVSQLSVSVANASAGAGSIGIDTERANGGFVDTGDVFLANEAGPELIGTIGGRTAVASNGEITGIRDAVISSGEVQVTALQSIMNYCSAILDKDTGVYIGDREIALAATRGQASLGVSIIS